jgi:hypothetical protein
VIKRLKRSKTPVALLVEQSALDTHFVEQLKRKRLALFVIKDLWKEGTSLIVQKLKHYAVIGVVEAKTLEGRAWGSSFEFIATCFYITGFRPLLIEFVGKAHPKHLKTILEVLKKAYLLGEVRQSSVTLID